MTKLPLGKIAGSAAVIQDNKVLLLKRATDSALFPDHWTFPSGSVEDSDLSIECASVREVKEETGLDFVSKWKLGFYESHAGGKRHFALVHVGEVTGEIMLQETEVQSHGWFTYTEAKELPLAFAYAEVLNDLHKKGLLK